MFVAFIATQELAACGQYLFGVKPMYSLQASMNVGSICARRRADANGNKEIVHSEKGVLSDCALCFHISSTGILQDAELDPF